jgi:hypothetical protein
MRALMERNETPHLVSYIFQTRSDRRSAAFKSRHPKIPGDIRQNPKNFLKKTPLLAHEQLEISATCPW